MTSSSREIDLNEPCQFASEETQTQTSPFAALDHLEDATSAARNYNLVTEKPKASSTLQLPVVLREDEDEDDQQRILSLPPPPSYDVHIDSLSIGVPPRRLYIPTPIPIPIPQVIVDFKVSSRWGDANTTTNNNNNDNNHSNASNLEEEDDNERIIRNVSAHVRAGEMMAVIGGSGSGKTTLLHAVAGRLGGLPVVEGGVRFVPAERPGKEFGFVDGESLRGKEEWLKKGMIANVVGFVRQHDYLLPHLTVRETLTSAARLRLPVSAHAYIDEIVSDTIRELGLAECADTTVGGTGTGGTKGISGGEKRRLSIGCVLVSFPSVLILDEVTTGLDSFTAYHLLLTLSRLAAKGRTILISLHQPRSDAFYLFSSILLMSRGSIVYSGLTSTCLGWFESLGVDMRDEEDEREGKERVERLIRAWRERERVGEVEREKRVPMTGGAGKEEEKVSGRRERIMHFGRRRHKDDDDVEANFSHNNNSRERHLAEGDNTAHESVIYSSTKRPGVFHQTYILLPRSYLNMSRAYPELIGHFLQALILVVPVYGYMSQVVWTYKWCLSLVIFDREREDGLYQPLAWMISELVAWVPVNVVGPVVYSVLVYFVCGLRTDDINYNFGVFVIDIIMIQMCFVAWALFAASIERSFARASLLGNALSIFFILSPGFFLVNVPGWIRWFRYISPYFYSFRIVILSQLRHRTFPCPSLPLGDLAQCSGDNSLQSLRINPTQPLWPMFMGNVGFIVVVLAMSWVLLSVWKPGGVRYAAKVVSGGSGVVVKGKGQSNLEMDRVLRARVEVQVRSVTLAHLSTTVNFDLKSSRHGQTTIPILTDVTARFPSGEVSVIMGPSGSGKSTFLRMCAGRPIKAAVGSRFVPGGQILFNGVAMASKKRMRSVYDDYHLPALTVRETLRYAAMIKLPSSISRKTKLARAEEVLTMLGLKECANVLVGGELLKGISGGEKRRLSLACQMINDPAVLIVDEPTSGLDANTARNVMEALQDIARSGRTVIASLHQPRSDIYNMCDNLTILAKQGNVVFHGPREQLLPHFAMAGYVCPPLYNPSDFCMDLISVDMRSPKRLETSTARVQNLVEHWRNRHEKLAEYVYTPKEEGTREPAWTGDIDERAERTPMWIALPVVLDRMMRNTWRLPDLFWTRWTQAPILAICFFIFYLRLSKGPTGAQDRIGLIAECTSSIAFVGFLNLVATYPMEKTVFFNDYKAAGGRYSSATFIIAFTLFAITPEFISALVFSVIMNVATGMRTNARVYFEFAIAIWAQLNFGESIGIAFASFFDTMGLSVSLVSVFLTFAAQSSGVFSASVAKFLDDIAWVFPMKYAARIMLVNEMRGLEFACTDESVASGTCTAANGDQVLELFGFEGLSTWKMTVVCVAVTVGYRIAAWCVLAVR
ncbi:P-loop containing nucleoside triphosphate hydrolase protein [Irpex rosettiformis]|uniref:P-loop containing nucleoside triphosphate hydrolase protein n=1 Tax=Irpex rosettiformis TaxID=378272 RepID=A0ACB8TXV0_9APHY|nr:P-loop containing nucleoside triphosphate hydrolase protein [Irpex rosettiformis]